MKNRWLVFSSLLVVLALVAVACGDDDTATTATTTTVAGTTAATTTVAPEPEVVFDTGVVPAPCDEGPIKHPNADNGCIYLGVISDLSDGPFAPLAIPLTLAQEDFWAAVNADGQSFE